MSELQLLYKSVPAVLKQTVTDVDTAEGIICGYWSSFNFADDGNPPDVVCPGAFKKTIAENGPQGSQRIKFLWQHHADALLGEPFELCEDSFGLAFKAQIVDTTWGKDILKLYLAKVIKEHSIGYIPIVAPYDAKQGVRFLKEVALFEGSAVVWGMNRNTPVTDVKSVGGLLSVAEHMARVNDVLHKGDLRDQRVIALLQGQYDAWEAEVKAAQPAEPAHERITTAQEYGALSEQKLAALVALVAEGVRQALAEEKAASGSTSVPLGERTEAWSGSEAHNAVVALATKEDGSLDASIMKKAHFWYDESAPDQIGSYKLIYCTVKGKKLQAVWKGITGCAGALQGARGTGVDIPSGDEDAVKKKIEAWYAKAAKQYEDDTIVAPWKQDEKARRGTMRRKDFNYLLSRPDYAVRLQQQLAAGQKDYTGTLAGVSEDLQQLWANAWNALVLQLRRDMQDAVWGPIGGGEDKPDVKAVITTDVQQFLAVLLELVDKSVAADFVPCGDDDGDGFYNPAACDDDDYGMMSARSTLATKEGRKMSAANHKALSASLAKIAEGHAEAKSLMAKMKPSNADDGEADTSDNSPDNDNDAKGALRAHPGAGATAHTTGNLPAGASEHATPVEDEIAAAFNAAYGRLRTFTGD